MSDTNIMIMISGFIGGFIGATIHIIFKKDHTRQVRAYQKVLSNIANDGVIPRRDLARDVLKTFMKGLKNGK